MVKKINEYSEWCSILNVKVSDSIPEIKVAFKALCLKYHPDVNKSPSAHNDFIIILNAYSNIIKYKNTPNNSVEQGIKFNFVSKDKKIHNLYKKYVYVARSRDFFGSKEYKDLFYQTKLNIIESQTLDNHDKYVLDYFSKDEDFHVRFKVIDNICTNIITVLNMINDSNTLVSVAAETRIKEHIIKYINFICNKKDILYKNYIIEDISKYIFEKLICNKFSSEDDLDNFIHVNLPFVFQQFYYNKSDYYHDYGIREYKDNDHHYINNRYNEESLSRYYKFTSSNEKYEFDIESRFPYHLR